MNLGSRTLQPWRQLMAGRERIHLGKRALGILSVLAEAKGEIVTKDEIFRAVWPRITVGENTLTVHVVALRKALGPDAKRLKTIHGIGYRLDMAPTPAETATAVWQGSLGRLQNAVADSTVLGAVANAARHKNHRVLALGAIAPFLAASVYGSFHQNPAYSDDTVYLAGFEKAGGMEADLLTLSLRAGIEDALGQSRIDVVSGGSGMVPPDDAGQTLRGTIVQDGAQLKIHLSLEDAASKAILWSQSFDGDAASSRQLTAQASVSVARTIYAIRELGAQKGVAYGPSTLALHIRGSELVRSPQLSNEGTAREIYQSFVSQAPNSAYGHALLAIAWANEARNGQAETRASLLNAGRKEAEKAITLDPARAGPGYDALYLMARTEHPSELESAERILLSGIRNAPDFAYLHMRECRFLTEVGQPGRALPFCQRALALHPFAEPIHHSYARALNTAGDLHGATAVIERAAYLFPDHGPTRRARFEFAAFGGRYDEALHLLENPATVPWEIEESEAKLWKRYLRAKGVWQANEADAMAKEFSEEAESGEISIDWAIMALASMGRTDEAFALLRSQKVLDSLYFSGSSFLFQPATASLREDRRFWDSAATIGLPQYWEARRKWPEFCYKRFPVSRCKAETANALHRNGLDIGAP